MTASSVSPPAFMTWTALAQALTPPLLRLALEMAMNLGRDCDLAMRIIGNAAAPRMAARRLKAMLMCGPSCREKDIMSQVGWGGLAAGILGGARWSSALLRCRSAPAAATFSPRFFANRYTRTHGVNGILREGVLVRWKSSLHQARR